MDVINVKNNRFEINNRIKKDDKIYLYGDIKKINILSNYFKNLNIEPYYLENINVKDLKYITKKIISFMKKNQINYIYILDGSYKYLYNECKMNNISVLNNEIFFKDEKMIRYSIKTRLNIPIFRKTNNLIDYNNLLIAGFELEYPLLLKSNNIILQKINNSRELVTYKVFIENFIKYFNYDNNLYLEEFFDKSRKIIVNFINYNNEMKILNIFEVLYVFMEHNIFIKSCNLDDDKYKIIENDVKNIVKYFHLKFGYIEFILSNDYIFFNKITDIDSLLFYDRNLIKQMYKIDLFDLFFLNKIELNDSYETEYLMINELNFNYNNFLPFYEFKKQTSIYKNKLTHLKKMIKSKNIKDDFLRLVQNTENIFFKELILNKTKHINDYLFIHNIFNEKDIFLMKIINSTNDNYSFKSFIKNNNYKFTILDNVNSRLGNYILKNNINDFVLEIKDNNIKILFYNKTFISITGSENVIIKLIRENNNIEIDFYKMIEIKNGDLLSIKRTTDYNLNYISIKGGFKIHNKNINNQDKIRRGKIILFNLYDRICNNNKFTLDKNLIPKLKKRLKLNVIKSGFNDYLNDNVNNFIFKNRWLIKKKNDNIILLINKRFISHFENIFKIKKSIKYYKYPRGTILINNLGLLIVNSTNYNYYEGYAILNLIDIDTWQLNYLNKNYEIGFNEVSLEYACNKKKCVELFFEENKEVKTFFNINYLTNIEKTKLVYLNRFEKNWMMNIQIRQLGDEYLIVIFNKRKKDINDNNYIELAFIQKNLNEILKDEEIDVINGYDFFIIKLNGVKIDYITERFDKCQDKINSIGICKNKVLKLPIVLSKKYFSDKKYLNTFLRINQLKDENELCEFFKKAKFIVIENRSVEGEFYSIIPLYPSNRLYMIERDIRENIENGSICLGNFFINIHKNKNEENNIFCKTLPVFNKEGESVFNYFDILEFELIENEKFNSIYNHYILGNYIIDVTENLFDINNYKKYFNDNYENFVKEKKIKLNNYKKYEKEFITSNDNTKNNLLNIHSIKCNEDINILKIYIKLNQNIKFGERICKVKNKDNVKYYIKSNINGLITQIYLNKYNEMKKNENLIKILEY